MFLLKERQPSEAMYPKNRRRFIFSPVNLFASDDGCSFTEQRTQGGLIEWPAKHGGARGVSSERSRPYLVLPSWLTG